jgi:hypothetical protein
MANVTVTNTSRTRETRRHKTTITYVRNGKAMNYRDGRRIAVAKDVATLGPAAFGAGAAGLVARHAMTRAIGAKKGTIQRKVVRINKKTGARKAAVMTVTRAKGVSAKQARIQRQSMVRAQVGSRGIARNSRGYGISSGRTRRNQARDSRGRFR